MNDVVVGRDRLDYLWQAGRLAQVEPRVRPGAGIRIEDVEAVGGLDEPGVGGLRPPGAGGRGGGDAAGQAGENGEHGPRAPVGPQARPRTGPHGRKIRSPHRGQRLRPQRVCATGGK